jgi:hypothetical protein
MGERSRTRKQYTEMKFGMGWTWRVNWTGKGVLRLEFVYPVGVWLVEHENMRTKPITSCAKNENKRLIPSDSFPF